MHFVNFHMCIGVGGFCISPLVWTSFKRRIPQLGGKGPEKSTDSAYRTVQDWVTHSEALTTPG